MVEIILVFLDKAQRELNTGAPSIPAGGQFHS